MANFGNPAVLWHDLLAFVKLNHTFDGLYIWEFFTTLDYEWHVIQGRIRHRWTIWIYSLTRLATLMTVIMDIVDLNLPTPTNCKVRIVLIYVFASSTYALSSLLIILRIIAIWDWNKGIVGFATFLWVTNVSLLIHGAIQIRSSWIPMQNICDIPDLNHIVTSFSSVFISDFVLLAIMLVGLLRLRRRSAGTCGIGLLLWKQGLVLLLLATAAGLPPLVLVSMNLNEAFDLMFIVPSVTVISIAGTRMHRSLANYNSTNVQAILPLNYVSALTRCDRSMMCSRFSRPRLGDAVPSSRSNDTVSTPPEQVEVTMHPAHGNYRTSITDGNVVCVGGDARDRPGQLQHDKPMA